MKKALSFVLAMVLVFAMSVPALAVDVPDENTSYSTFSDYLNISLTHLNLDQKAKDFLSEWRNSGSNILLSEGDSRTYIVYFVIAPLTSTISYHSFYENGSYVSYVTFSDDVRVLNAWSVNGSVGIQNISSGKRVALCLGGIRLISGSYFVNTNSNWGDDVQSHMDTRKYTLTDSYGIFTGWESSFEIPAIRYSVNVDYSYTDGTQAAPPVSKKYYVGDSYNIPSPYIDGYTADIPIVVGTVSEISDTNISHQVVYRETPCRLTVNYRYEDGTQSAPPFIGHFEKGERYNISSPYLAGYLPNYPVISGTVSASDIPDLVFDVVYRVDRSVIVSGDFEPLTRGLIETVAVIFMVCCSLYAVVLSVKCVIELLLFMTR